MKLKNNSLSKKNKTREEFLRYNKGMFRKAFTPLETIGKQKKDMMSLTGFTLIELIMVILIIAILSAVIITDIISSTSSVKLAAAAWKLKSDIIYAQSLAVTQGLNHAVIFGPPAETYSVYVRPGPGPEVTIVEHPLTSQPFSVNYSTDSNFKGVDIVSTSFGAPTTNRVEFDSYGTPSDGANILSADGVVTLSLAGVNRIVRVTKNTGKVN